jgi:hypothetical protein
MAGERDQRYAGKTEIRIFEVMMHQEKLLGVAVDPNEYFLKYSVITFMELVLLFINK